MIILFLILAISPFSLVIKSQKLLDPFGANKAVEKEEKPDKSEEYQIAATLASIMDESLAEDAFKKANEVNQAVSFSIPMTATYALAKPVITGSINPANKEVFKKYIVQAGDTLWTIARDHEITTDSIRWANADITDIDAIKPGTELLIPSTVGVLYTVKEGESIEGIASKYGISVAMIESYNNIIDEELTPGMKIMIPDATGPEYIKPEPQETRVASDYDSSYNDAPSYIEPSSGPNRFPYGYCTWWVAHKRYVPWNGNAWQWYGNAIAYGYAVGDMPVTGAILVTWESYVGHVAYVESVNGDGSFNISEMNYVGWGRSSSRTVTTGSVPFIGFIY
ncbi:MAG: LysM peptidoglycan-binding domain-containing protein [Patescibacteria group bacterium]|nr:LysM peptidoglycan-binding domain-containing protein [Patescibacteria group bacterium]